MPEIGVGERPVTQITVVEPAEGKVDEALELMLQRAQFMSKQPGFVSITLHRSVDGRRIVNYIQWESGTQLRAAHELPEFRKEWSRFDTMTDEISPDLYEIVKVFRSDETPSA